MPTRMILLIAAIASPAAAHDFWIQPAAFHVAVGAPVAVTLLVGHGTDRQRWGAKAARVVRFATIVGATTVDRRALLHTESGSDDATLSFASPGTHIVMLETNHATSVLPAIRFDDYVKVEGLTPAATLRAGKPASAGREIYSRRAKALIQVGAPMGAQPWITRPIGQTLEIVPQINPYRLVDGQALPVRVYYRGQPLGGATVKLVNLDADSKPAAVRLTGSDGRVAFDVPRRGRWQLNVVWTRPIVGHPDADYDTTFASLTFGFDRRRG